MTNLQERRFAAAEGDAWFDRNIPVLRNWDAAQDLPLRLISMYGLTPRRALEVGAAHGHRMAALAVQTGCKAVCVEISRKATLEGARLWPDVSFMRGTISHVPVARQSFDLVVVNFVLHWVSRALIVRAVAEIDRVLAPGGFVVLGDFHPDAPRRNRYHHVKDEALYTYKEDYARRFERLGHRRLALLTTGHQGPGLRPEPDGNERIAIQLTRKPGPQERTA